MATATTTAPPAPGPGSGAPGASGTSVRLRVQKLGTFLSNMVLPNIGAFIAWGLITALFIQTGWIALIAKDVFGADTANDPLGFVSVLGAWKLPDGTPMHDSLGIVGPMLTYLLPLLIGYTGGRMTYDGNMRGGVVGAIATMGAITGADVPMFLGAMIMGPLGGYTMKRLDALWAHKIRPGFEMLVNNFSAGIWGGILAVLGFLVAGPFVTGFSNGAESIVNWLVERNLLPFASVLIEPAKVLFLNNAINQGIFTPLGTTEAGDTGRSILFLLEANPGPGLGLLLAFMVFGRGVAKASAPGAALIQFVGGIHEIYFPYVLAKPVLILAMICGGASGVLTNVIFDSGLRSPASPGSIIAVIAAAPPSSLVGVLLSVVVAAGVTFLVAGFLLKIDRSTEDVDLVAATADMETRKGRKSSVASALTGGATASGPIRSIVFACDAGMGSSAMGASVLRRKVHTAGHGDVTVTNLAISNLTDEPDVVVTHRDLTERARGRAPSALHVSVDDFMSSPQYDEIVAMIDRQGSGDTGDTGTGAPSLAKEPEAEAGAGRDVLREDAVVLGGHATTRDEAISEAGRLLVSTGAADQAYADAMHERETSVSTAMGNGLAIPHGTNEAKTHVHRTAITFVRYDSPLDWGGKEVRFVVGIAAAGQEHLALLGRIAKVFSDREQVDRLERASSSAEVMEVLGQVQPA
ncbi:PTS sugar transporter subunit IIA [Nocardioides marinquilinus]|uniref:Mannitol-specific phosphotransferase enzyme IIA component n=1 Tax=Nocardioides marinquilinus TaxID=1210400 RepID=A0ABP9PQ36_9ACTN